MDFSLCFPFPDVKFDALSGDYFPILYFNDYWNLQRDYFPINESVQRLPFRLSFCPLSLWRWQLYAAQSSRSPWNFLGEDLYEQSDDEQDSVKVTPSSLSPIFPDFSRFSPNFSRFFSDFPPIFPGFFPIFFMIFCGFFPMFPQFFLIFSQFFHKFSRSFVGGVFLRFFEGLVWIFPDFFSPTFPNISLIFYHFFTDFLQFFPRFFHGFSPNFFPDFLRVQCRFFQFSPFFAGFWEFRVGFSQIFPNFLGGFPLYFLGFCCEFPPIFLRFLEAFSPIFP